MSRQSSFISPIALSINVLCMGLVLMLGVVHASEMDELITNYQKQGAQHADADRARALWSKKFPDKNGNLTRSCASCHTENLLLFGKHVRTNKAIGPLAPSVNRERLTDARKIEKWFRRNCRWTLGRKCSAQEKSDFLQYISSQ